MSEWGSITKPLEKLYTFRNTFYHAEPKLDILNPSPSDFGAYDFVISSEVFEHVPPPVQIAFDNLASILKPTGFVVFSVPWAPEGQTIEHFPALYDWQLTTGESGPVLVNRTQSGVVEAFDNLVFHGGPGQTLEMRLFSKPDLVGHFQAAGFRDIRFAEPEEKYGIVWQPWSVGLVARKQ
jgi:SAM-dependent methyltransferase